MNRTLYINAIAFVLGLSIGVAVDSFVTGRSTQERRWLVATTADDVRPITIYSVPSVDFPAALTNTGLIYGSVKLIATFEADGSVTSIRPYPMIPFGVSESAAGVGEFAAVTPFTLQGRFVDSLPPGVTESAIQQTSRITFKSKTRNGRSETQRVFVLTEYSYLFADSSQSDGCAGVDVTIIDDTGILWQGNTWVSRNVRCPGLR